MKTASDHQTICQSTLRQRRGGLPSPQLLGPRQNNCQEADAVKRAEGRGVPRGEAGAQPPATHCSGR